MVTHNVGADMVTTDTDDRVTEDIRRGEATVEGTVTEMGSIIGAPRGLDTDVPKDITVIRDSLEEHSRVGSTPATTPVGGGPNEGSGIDIIRETGEVNGGGIDGTAEVGEGGEVLEGVNELEKAVAYRDLDELGVELGGEEAGDHIGDLGDEKGIQGVGTG